MAMNPGRTPHLLVPGNIYIYFSSYSFPAIDVMSGEWFWLSQSIYKPNLFIHIYLATCTFQSFSFTEAKYISAVGGIGALFQFLPVIRRVSSSHWIHFRASPCLEESNPSSHKW
jgi:hypothetical protein